MGMICQIISIVHVMLPRRKHFILNLFLFTTLLFLTSFIAIREWNSKLKMLPPGESRIWPTDIESIVDQGEMGSAVLMTAKEIQIAKTQMKTAFMNIIASDKIAVNRTLPEVRMLECLKIIYDTSVLPRASVVIIFIDETWSTLMRTIHSVINRSPSKLLAEVLLIDNFSQKDELKQKLDDYLMKMKSPLRLIRLKKVKGLAQAKLFGAENAKGEVVVFLDARCEVNNGWLEPLLQRIYENPKAIVCPVVDYISAWDFSYSGKDRITSIGSFSWNLNFRWEPMSEAVLNALKSSTKPILSPVMTSELLAADRTYFLKLGGYDPGMNIWDEENLEISFRVWMCGGSVELIPCSHVGHVLRKEHVYNKTDAINGHKDVFGTNSKRVAEVWMDDYKRLLYVYRKDLVNRDVGNLSERIRLRKKLNCHSFKWYLENIVPQKFIPDEDVLGYGALRNAETNMCLDTMQKNEKKSIPISLFTCQFGGSNSQVFSLTKDNLFRREIGCLHIDVANNKIISNRTAVLSPCLSLNTDSQRWKWEVNGLMRNIKTNLCMGVPVDVKNGHSLIMLPCNASSIYQKWELVKM